MSKVLILLSALVLVTAAGVGAQGYPPTLVVPVTYYDFHSNGSNPDFNHLPTGKPVGLGMVKQRLGSNGVPVCSLVIRSNWGLDKWFLPWQAGDFRRPVYNADETLNNLINPYSTDTSYINKEIDGQSLTFTYHPELGTGVYQFQGPGGGGANFFPLNGMGYGAEGIANGDNYSFTMKLHFKFTCNLGLFFKFTGDDDLWTFVDSQLVIDLGGHHIAKSDSFTVDQAFITKYNLQIGQTYSFDVFYCERNQDASDILITSNIISAPPTSIKMTVVPDAAILSAGQTQTYTAHVMKSDNNECDLCNQNVHWTLTSYTNLNPLTPVNSQSYLSPVSKVGQVSTFNAVTAYTYNIITATFDTVINNQNIHLFSLDTIYVIPGAVTHLNIEPVSDSTASLWNDNPFPQRSLTLQSTEQSHNVYAVLRDAFGNWVSHATLASWSSAVPTIATAASTTNRQLGEGVITRQAPSGATSVIATQGGLSDTLQVTVSNVQYSQVQIYVLSGGIVPIDFLTMRTDQDTTLRARGQWATDPNRWDDLMVHWGNSAGLTFDNTAPASGQSWTFNPQAPGNGTIFIDFASGPNVLRDTVKVTFLPGLPFREALYPLPGTPNTATPANQVLPASVTVVAGVPFQIVAKLFDNKNRWLNLYERADAPITWTRQPLSGTLSATAGYLTSFTDTKAGDVIKITAAYVQEPGNTNIVPPQSITISIIAGPATHLVIEGDSARSRSPNADNPVGTVTIGARDTSAMVYAILRDAYGNWVDYSKAAAWSSADVSQAVALPGNTNIGQGILIRRTASGQTVVTARDTSYTGAGFTGTVKVVLSNISYDSLRIVVGSTNTQIQSLVMRTDVGDTTLNVQGKRSDNGQWEYVPADWSIVPALKTSTLPPQSSSWKFTPIDTGSGIVVVNKTGSVPDTITVHFLPGLAYSLVLYSGPGTPGGANTAYQSPATAIIDTAGKPLQMYAKIFDRNGVWLGSYERASAPVAWNIVELTGNPPTGALNNARGYTSTLTPTRAYNTLYVIARLDSAGLPVAARDTVQIQVVHAAPSQLVIEADPNWQVKANAATPVDSVRIANNQTWVPVYALIRDRFGNFVQYSTNTGWGSINNNGNADSSIVSVHNGTNTIGEGIVRRVAAEGSERVYASSKEFPGLSDTIKAIVLKYYYMQLNIVVGNANIPIDSLLMSINDDTTLKVIGLRSDTAIWEPAPGTWITIGGIKTPGNPPVSSTSWQVIPSDTGRGWIKVTQGNATPDSIFVHFVVGAPDHIVLYPFEGPQTGFNQPYPPPGQQLIDTAGTALPVVAMVFDRGGHWLSSYERSSAPITWMLFEQPANQLTPTGSLIPGSGDKTSFLPTWAYNSVLVIATFSESGNILKDSVAVTIVPGKPDHLVLEADPKQATSPNHDNPQDSLLLPKNQIIGFTYGVVRDKFGNWIGNSQSSLWFSRDTSVATVEDGQKSVGQGVIRQNPAGILTKDVVLDTCKDYPGLVLLDSVKVVILGYYYTALRIVVGNNTDISDLNMNTNQDTTLLVLGQRSDDPSRWEPVQANWENSAGLRIVPGAPMQAEAWRNFSPSAPGTGWIRVTLGNDIITKPDTVQVTFTVGPPVLIETEILTPPNQRIAGDTIIAVTQIRNKDGLVPGQWCDSTTYQNALGTGGGGRPNPTVDSVNMGKSMYECFQNGLDTVKYVLYYAPVSPDSLEKVMVTMRVGTNVLSASSDPFRVYPGALARLSLEDFNGKNIDSVYLVSPTGSKLIIAAGYDAYGNYRGPENSNWTVDGTLHAIDKPTGVPRVFYETGQVKYDEDGYIRASATGKGGVVVSDSARVVITGRAATLMSAVTHDTSGNGLLDEITLVFDRKVTLPAGTRIQLSNGSYMLVVSSVRGQTSGTSATVNGTTGLLQGDVGLDSVFTVVLSESNKTVPQTGWKPSLTISGVSGMASVNGFTVTDGAGPVIWSIVKTIGSPSDRSQDKVTVTFSEPIGTNGNDFTKALPPAGVFRVWEMQVDANGDTTYTEVTGMLSGIMEFYQVENNGLSVSFYMSNGKDLTTRDYFNIVFDSSGRITDKDPPLVNGPVPDNQRVEVTVRSEPAREILVVPNPSAPTFVRQQPGVLRLEHQPDARRWVRQDGAGTVMTFRIAPASGEKVTGYLAIYDVVGNLVASADSSRSAGIIPPSWVSSDSSAYDYDIYWNGSNSKGTKVAAGVYQAMLYLKYTDQAGNSRNTKLLGRVGISK